MTDSRSPSLQNVPEERLPDFPLMIQHAAGGRQLTAEETVMAGEPAFQVSLAQAHIVCAMCAMENTGKDLHLYAAIRAIHELSPAEYSAMLPFVRSCVFDQELLGRFNEIATEREFAEPAQFTSSEQNRRNQGTKNTSEQSPYRN